MEDIFEEWNVYASKKSLKERDINLEDIKKNSRLKIQRSYAAAAKTQQRQRGCLC